MLKSIIRYAFNKIGYNIERLAAKKAFSIGSVGRLSNHSLDVDLFRYSDKGSATSQFIDKLNSGEYKLIERDCISCGSENYLIIGQSEKGFIWVICKECGIVQLRIQLEHQALNDFYKSGEYQSLCMGGRDDYSHFILEKDVMSQVFVNIFESLGVDFNGKKVLEIGCGSGGILVALSEKGMICTGYDLNETRIKAGKNLGVERLFCADAMDSKVDLSAFEYIIISNVLEHLYDPLMFLNDLKEKLVDDSQKIIIDVPNVDGISSHGEYTSDFFHVAHLWYFSPITLRSILEKSGFTIEYVFRRGAAMTFICSISLAEFVEKDTAYNTTLFSISHSNRRYL